MNRRLNKIKEEAGVAALEFALVFPFFVIMLLFLIEFARQQYVMILFDRIALQATFVTRFSEDPSSITIDEVKKLFAPVPKWIYENSDPGKLRVSAVYGDNLEEIKTAPKDGFGGKGQTVCLRVSVNSGIIGWLPRSISPVTSRVIENCYVNAQ